VLGLFPRRSAIHTIAFLERVVEEIPFPIQHLQTDRGREFFALSVQRWLKQTAIKFRPIRPASPHLNGKVERSHQTDLLEFYATADLKASDLAEQLDLWQHAYNWDRPHSSLGGKHRLIACASSRSKRPSMKRWRSVTTRRASPSTTLNTPSTSRLEIGTMSMNPTVYLRLATQKAIRPALLH